MLLELVDTHQGQKVLGAESWEVCAERGRGQERSFIIAHESNI